MQYDINNIDLRGKMDFNLSRCSLIEQLKDNFGCSLPEYESFVLKYGAAEIANMIRVYAPDEILKQYEEFRERWNTYYHWGDSESALEDDELQECFPIAYTFNGDEFIFKPGEKRGIYVLPRNEDIVYYAGQDLSDLINFAMLSGKLFDLNEYYNGNPPTQLWIS